MNGTSYFVDQALGDRFGQSVFTLTLTGLFLLLFDLGGLLLLALFFTVGFAGGLWHLSPCLPDLRWMWAGQFHHTGLIAKTVSSGGSILLLVFTGRSGLAVERLDFQDEFCRLFVSPLVHCIGSVASTVYVSCFLDMALVYIIRDARVTLMASS